MLEIGLLLDDAGFCWAAVGYWATDPEGFTVEIPLPPLLTLLLVGCEIYVVGGGAGTEAGYG